jgi:hypothetical protein
VEYTLGLDPGTTHTGYAIVKPDYSIVNAAKVPNEEIFEAIGRNPLDAVAIESMNAYGMAVGREVFEACYWIGEFRHKARTLGTPCFLYPRPEWGRSLTGVRKNTDSAIRQALLLRFGGDKKGEPLHMLKGSSDKRSAYGVAVYHLDLTRAPARKG